jgi:hypothetical protein
MNFARRWLLVSAVAAPAAGPVRGAGVDDDQFDIAGDAGQAEHLRLAGSMDLELN